MSALPAVKTTVESCAQKLAALVDAPIWPLADRQAAEVVARIEAARASLDELESRLIRHAEEREIPAAEGAASTAAWVAGLTGEARAAAARRVSLARLMDDDCEPVRRAWATGQVNAAQARVIVEAVDKLPDWFGGDERTDAQTTLLEYAGEFDLDGLKRLANRIVEVVDPDGADEILGRQLEQAERRAWDQSRFVMRRRGDGTTGGSFVVPDLVADMLRTALEGITAPRRLASVVARHGRAEDDPKSLSFPQRLGLGFCELVEHLPAGALPQAGGLAATIAVTIDHDKLAKTLGSAAVTTGLQISASEARRLACNASILPVVLDGESRVLDAGLAKRLHDRYQRLALAARDGGCCWPGCDRPPAWCEAHHLTPWAEGGKTSVEDGALFCYFHHHLIHDSDWEARMGPDGIVEVIPPPRIDPIRTPRRHERHTKLKPRAG